MVSLTDSGAVGQGLHGAFGWELSKSAWWTVEGAFRSPATLLPCILPTTDGRSHIWIDTRHLNMRAHQTQGRTKSALATIERLHAEGPAY